jgi:ligand-binding SRPBCC domain-containing protein
MQDQVFTAEQLVPLCRGSVFAFFSDPCNLERITPPRLRFRIMGRSTPELGEGTELTYRLRIHGVPVTWRSKIEEWRPNERFVDVQLRGPYAKWHHTHSFEATPSGTLVRDRVLYRLPLGRLGHWAVGRFVAADVRGIFAYRAARIAELLPPARAGAR